MGDSLTATKTNAIGLFVILAFVHSTQAVILGQYTFDGVNNRSASGVAPEISFSDVSAVNVAASTTGTSLVTGEGRGRGPRWTDGDYIQFTITPAANRFVKVNSITFNIFSSELLTAAFVQCDSGNGFGPAGSGTFSIDPSGPNRTIVFNMDPASNPVSVRFFSGQNNDNGRTITFDNISIDGQITDVAAAPVPEPANIALAIFGSVFAGVGLWRKLLKSRIDSERWFPAKVAWKWHKG